MHGRIRRRIFWELSRWLSPGMFLAAVSVSVLCYLTDIFSSMAVAGGAFGEGGGLFGSALRYFMLAASGVISSASMCLAVYLGAGAFAQDYEEGAVYMRVQRMGIGAYAGLRVWQTAASSFLAGSLGLLPLFTLMSLAFRIPVLEEGEVMSGLTDSRLILGGHGTSYLAAIVLLAGLRTAFYALVSLAVSLFITRLRVVVALPILLWYLFEFVTSGYGWLPAWLQPRYLFDIQHGLDSELMFGVRLPEWATLGIIAGGTAVAAAAVWLLFCLRLRRDRIFGGEQNE